MAVVPAVAEETFLSDVHLYTPFFQTSKNNVDFTSYLSYFKNNVCHEYMKLANATTGNMSETSGFHFLFCFFFFTRLQLIGFDQVWRGALLLSDFLVYNEERFNKCIALELGAGLGLCSIVLGRVAKKVFCTDLRENILRCCQNNITANSHLFKYGYDVVAVRKFDWLASGLPTGEGDFCWTKEDQEVLKNATVVLAADVIYDDSLTDAFIGTFLRLMEANKPITLLLTIERRLNFTLEELAVTSPAYNYFLSRIKELETKEQRLSTRKLDIDFPNYLQYERVKELELWEIKPA
ncbi:unnamed protein product [Porites evermanni]|uniref:Methyltransferase-like protein 22 n=1 Tax=Porites evermanni TaxID=104178 RepID=A0ABN8LUT7_9CNID|nr:unnamed protein product [Porites evermanni]